MSDGRALARSYLEQQRQLGGDPVVLSAGIPRPAQPLAAPPAPAAAPPSSAAPAARGARPTTRAAVPELPPPGIVYDPPAATDLFTTDPLRDADSLGAVAELVASCVKCRLCEARRHTVPGEGPAEARLVVVGEGPGRTEDETGRPFVGQAGDLLTKILAAIDLPRDRVYICNVVKCRPPENRTPQFDEIAACLPYLHRQLELLRPKVILAMGATAAQTLLNARAGLGALRNQIHRFRGTPLIVTYHPAALLRNPNWKKPTWDDVRIARRLLDA